MKAKNICIVFLFLFFNLGLKKKFSQSLQDLYVTSNLDTIEFAELDTFQIFFNLEEFKFRDLDYVVKWPDLSKINTDRHEINYLNKKEEFSQEYSIVCYDFGQIKIDSLPILFSMIDKYENKLDTVLYFTLSFFVRSQKTDGDFKNIKSIKEIKFSFFELLQDFYYRNRVFIIIISIICFFGLIVLIKKLRKNPNVKTHNKKVVNLEMYFLKKLSKIKNQEEEFFVKKRHKEFYSILSEILKEYLEKKHNMLAVESTTIDLIYILKLTTLSF